ncbi:MAG: ATP phosphoribosyltransferase regulatory subunit [Kiritimatiellaeota bacterium]|nr:ATP phosphoribosyltransferase regulatory subunit [Kiritimatiellota bacterium]
MSEQIYTFQDKSGRNLALRPEMTPTLARMVAARQGSLQFPLKWTTIAQCFRYERMTRGRKREHFQWNLDIIGEPSVSAEVEILSAATTAMRGLGVPDDAYVVRVNNRLLLSELLDTLHIPVENHPAIFLVLDKKEKISRDEILALLDKEGVAAETAQKALALLDIQTLDNAAEIAGKDSPAIAALRELFDAARVCGFDDRLRFDLSIIRGLSYYTGIVFEAFDTAGKFRAIFGGGRYDSLLSHLGGERTPAVGLGFGDVVVQELLNDLFPPSQNPEPYVHTAVSYMTPEQREAALRLAAKLRGQGRTVDLALAPQKPKQFFSRAAAVAQHAVFIGPDDLAKGAVKSKNLATREEVEIPLP